MVKSFDQPGHFSAMATAEKFLRDAGYSVGPLDAETDGKTQRAIMRGDVYVAPWRLLTPAERATLAGQMTGDMCAGPVIVEIFDGAQ